MVKYDPDDTLADSKIARLVIYFFVILVGLLVVWTAVEYWWWGHGAVGPVDARGSLFYTCLQQPLKPPNQPNQPNQPIRRR